MDYGLFSIYLPHFKTMALGFGRRKNSGEGATEMSFIDHLEVLRGHLFRSVVAVAIGAVVAGIYNKFIIKSILLGPTHNDFPTYPIICNDLLPHYLRKSRLYQAGQTAGC